MTKFRFKAGDRIRALEDNPYGAKGVKEGDLARITAGNSGDFSYRDEKGTWAHSNAYGNHGSDWWGDADLFEQVDDEKGEPVKVETVNEFKNGDKVQIAGVPGGKVYTYIGKGASGHVVQGESGNLYETTTNLEPYTEPKLEVGQEYTLHGARFIVVSLEHIGDYTRAEGVSLGLRTPKDKWVADSISGSTLLNHWTKVDNS